MRFLFRLAALLGLAVLASFIAFDRPKAVLDKTVDDAKCALNKDWCPPIVAKMVLPNVAVLFVATDLVVREGRQVAIMAEEWPFCDDETGDVFVVPKYFETDFASIPGWAQFYVKPSDKNVIGGAIAHDWLYAVGGDDLKAAKARADNIFRRELKNAGVNVVKRNVMYQAVANFGGTSFGTAEEMRFRDPRTGEAKEVDLPASPIVETLGAGCPGFLEKYWRPRMDEHNLGYGLSPRVIFRWIDF